jgi:hypothetical protein
LADDAERSRRDALLLELGALVYELHRHGRRAPELLQERAAELDALEDRGGEGDVDQACPECGEPAEHGQLVCLNCGGRLQLDLEKQPRRTSPGALAALLAVAVLVAGAAGFAVSELTSGSEDDEQVQRAAEPAPPPETETATEPKPKAKGTSQKPKRSLLLKWPAGLTAHTVILVNAEDRGSARRVAIEAARTGIEAGVLRSEDYDLGSGLWIVFAGRFDTRRGAERQAEDLSLRYPGTYVQLIEPRSQ